MQTTPTISSQPSFFSEDETVNAPPCPRCGKRAGYKVLKTIPMFNGIQRSRISLCCAYRFDNFEKWPARLTDDQ